MKKIILFPLALIFFGCKNDYQKGIEEFNSGNYKEAKLFFEKLKVGDEHYTDALLKTYHIDSVLYSTNFEQQKIDSIQEIERRKQDSLEYAQRKAIEKDDLIQELEEKINYAGNYKYTPSNDINSLYGELETFAEWWGLIKDSEKYEENEIKNLGDNLRSKTVRIQQITFPKLRKSYGEISNRLLWEQNISVKTIGRSHTTIELVAGMFSDNGNKKEVQEMLSENFYRFRFKRSQYKWYKHDDEYTYYTMESDKDKEIVFKN